VSRDSGDQGSSALLQEMIDGTAELAALVNHDGAILAANEQWLRAVERQGAWFFLVGCDYPSALRDLIAAGDTRMQAILQAFTEVSAGTRQSFQCIYVGTGILSGRDHNIRFSPIEVGGSRCVLINAQDLTELNDLKRQRRGFGSKIVQAQEDERRRLAREIHDSTSQLLVVLQFNLMNLRRVDGHKSNALVADCMNVLEDVHSQIRNLSFMAAPPSLATNGLGNALEALVTGFASRAGLEVDLQVSDVDQASASVELAVYRLAQEALANIHRHAAADRANVRLVGTKRCLHLVISDNGVGFDFAEGRNGQSLGVGVLGMAERVRELGGRFSIHRSQPKGTILSASLPRSKSGPALPLAP
jgi:two-component system NarL family sensor kinase